MIECFGLVVGGGGCLSVGFALCAGLLLLLLDLVVLNLVCWLVAYCCGSCLGVFAVVNFEFGLYLCLNLTCLGFGFAFVFTWCALLF